MDLVGVVSPRITDVMDAVPTRDFVAPRVARPRLLMCLCTQKPKQLGIRSTKSEQETRTRDRLIARSLRKRLATTPKARTIPIRALRMSLAWPW